MIRSDPVRLANLSSWDAADQPPSIAKTIIVEATYLEEFRTASSLRVQKGNPGASAVAPKGA